MTDFSEQPTLQRVHYPLHKPERSFVPTEPSSIHLIASVLVVDPDPTWLPLLQERLPCCTILHRPDCSSAQQLFSAHPIDLVLLNHDSDHPCFELLLKFKASKPSVPVLIMAEHGSEDLAVRVFRKGARDYFAKPLQFAEVERSLKAILTLLQSSHQKGKTVPCSGMEKALATIQARFKNALSLSRIAEEAGMSISTFVRRFKQCTGMTFVDYVNGLRISHACRLLKSSRLSLLDISLACGFSQQAHFNRVFKKFSGMTPRQYRQSWDK